MKCPKYLSICLSIYLSIHPAPHIHFYIFIFFTTRNFLNPQYLSIHLRIHPQSIYLSIYPLTSISTYSFFHNQKFSESKVYIYLSTYDRSIHPPIVLSIHPSTSPSVHPFIYLSIHPPIIYQTIHLSIHPSIYQSIHPPHIHLLTIYSIFTIRIP